MKKEEIFKIVDKEFLVMVPRLEIVIPKSFIDYGVAEIAGSIVDLFGIFDFYVWKTEDDETEKPELHTFHIPSIITTIPGRITERGSGDEKEYVFEYSIGDRFMKSTSLPQSSEVVKRFIKLIFTGHIPSSIGYSDLITMWSQCVKINGVNLNVVEKILELIISEFARNPNDYSQTFRELLARVPDTDEKSRKMLRVEDIPRYTSTFASLTSADPKQGMTIATIRTREGKKSKMSPIEEAIR